MLSQYTTDLNSDRGDTNISTANFSDNIDKEIKQEIDDHELYAGNIIDIKTEIDEKPELFFLKTEPPFESDVSSITSEHEQDLDVDVPGKQDLDVTVSAEQNPLALGLLEDTAIFTLFNNKQINFKNAPTIKGISSKRTLPTNHTREKYLYKHVYEYPKNQLDPSSFVRHIQTEKKPYKCSVCEVTFSHSSTLSLHARLHTGEKPYKCNICGKEYSFSASLTSHLSEHSDTCKKTAFTCNLCPKIFSNFTSLATHTYTHASKKSSEINKKPPNVYPYLAPGTREILYKCNLCDDKFSSISKLEEHLVVHTEDKPYESLANEIFVEPSSVSKQVYDEQKMMFKCTICGKNFLKRVNLEAHIRKHTGEMRYMCTKCHKKFSRFSSFNEHFKQMHTRKKRAKVILMVDSSSTSGNDV